MLMVDERADADSFSYMTRTGDVTLIPGVVIDTVGIGPLTLEPRCLGVRNF